MYLFSKDKNECSGCSACKSICPRNCIEMIDDEYGFKYPVVNDSNCINCHLCEKICPIVNCTKKEQKNICYYGWHKNENIRLNSTSGAAFVGISELCFSNGYKCIYGATFNKKRVYHTCITDIASIKTLSGSKYVQSNMDSVFNDIVKKLKNDEKIVFVGTPCQVDGLERIVEKKYRNNLLLIALVCHGVASPGIFEKYLAEIEKKNGANVKNIRFRDKRYQNNELSHRFTTIYFDNNSEISTTDNLYTLMFGLGTITRDSCFKCPYTSPSGAGDITIGDFWGIENYDSNLKNEISKGISLIIPHTKLGEAICNGLNEYMYLNKVDLDYAVNNHQKQLSTPITCALDRESFLSKVMLKNHSFQRCAINAKASWKLQGYKNAIYRRIKRIIGK